MNKELQEFKITSSIDGSEEPSLFFKASGNEPRPLLVGLHTWSFGRDNQVENMLPIAKKNNWHLLLPEFRGPNKICNKNGFNACGSKLAKQDVIDAVGYLQENFPIRNDRIFLFGGSGGGQMGLLLAAYAPDLWAQSVVFCSITDVTKWYNENSEYSDDVAHCCGGKPEGDTVKEYEFRSPMTYWEDIAKARVWMFHGKYDKSVNFMHSFRLFNKISEKKPDSKVFITIFNGAHDILHNEAEKIFLSLDNIEYATGLTG